jgi:MATE family multidrug resistance protein
MVAPSKELPAASESARAPGQRGGIAGELRALGRLAGPLVAANASHMLMTLVDTAMVGRLGAAALGGTSVAGAITYNVSLLALGCVQGMDPLVSQAIGAGEPRHARTVLRAALQLALRLSVPTVALMALAYLALDLTGIDPVTVAQARGYLLGRSVGVLPFLLMQAARGYLQATGNTRPVLFATLVGNLVNLVGNALFIFGDGTLEVAGLPGIGLPALGTMGAGLATSLSLLVMALHLVAHLPGGYRAHAPAQTGDPTLRRRIARIGLPVGLQQFVEVAVFMLAALLAARLGAVSGAAHQVAISLASFTFMASVGISQATTVRVGLHVGRGDADATRRAGLVGIGLGLLLMSATAALFWLMPGPLAALLTADLQARTAAIPLIGIAACFQLFDGLQVVSAGALRGCGDTRSPLLGNLAGHYLVGLPLGIYLAFGAELGAIGLWWGLCTGLGAVGLVLTARFLRLSTRPVARL